MAGLKEFKEKLVSDEAFAKKFGDVKDPEELVALAGKEGFSFTAEDVKNNTELTDAELEAVAGGGLIGVKLSAIINKGVMVVNTGSGQYVINK